MAWRSRALSDAQTVIELAGSHESMRVVANGLTQPELDKINQHVDSQKQQNELYLSKNGAVDIVSSNIREQIELAKNVETAPELLQYFLRKEFDWQVRAAAVSNPNVSADLLDHALKNDGDWRVRMIAASSASASPNVLSDVLRTDAKWVVRLAVAFNEKTPEDAQEYALRQFDQPDLPIQERGVSLLSYKEVKDRFKFLTRPVRAEMSENHYSQKNSLMSSVYKTVSGYSSHDEFLYDGLETAYHIRCLIEEELPASSLVKPSLLARLLQRDFSIRTNMAAASNPLTPSDVVGQELRQINIDPSVSFAAVNNPNAPQDGLDCLLNGQTIDVIDSCNEEHLDRLREVAAEHPNASSETLADMLHRDDLSHHVVKNSSMPSELLGDVLRNRGREQVASLAAGNPSAPRDAVRLWNEQYGPRRQAEGFEEYALQLDGLCGDVGVGVIDIPPKDHDAELFGYKGYWVKPS